MDELLQQGITAHKAGKLEEARKIFITIVRQSPDNERAWGGMYEVSKNDKERVYFLKQILHINPNNKKARQLLKELTNAKLMSDLGGIARKPIVFISIMLFCVICICTISLFINDNDLVTLSTPTIKAPIVQPTLIIFPTQPGGGTGGECCKHCAPNSKPCGDSCISISYTCHKPPGCACY